MNSPVVEQNDIVTWQISAYRVFVYKLLLGRDSQDMGRTLELVLSLKSLTEDNPRQEIVKLIQFSPISHNAMFVADMSVYKPW